MSEFPPSEVLLQNRTGKRRLHFTIFLSFLRLYKVEAKVSIFCAKVLMVQKNTDMLTFYFDSQNEKCKRLLAGFPSFDPDFFDQFNENQTLGLLFMHYAMRKVITQSSGKNCDQLYRLFLPMRNLYLAKRLDPDLDFGNTSQIITEICGVPEDILDKGKRECDEVHVKIVKSGFDINVTWAKVRDANCSQLMGENNNTFVMDWMLTI